MQKITFKILNPIIVIVLISFAVIAKSPSVTTKGNFIMTNSNNVAYSVLYANAQRNSFIHKSLIATGELLWKKNYQPDFNEMVSPPIVILSNENTIGIQVNPYLIIYKNGHFLKSHWIMALSSDIEFFNDQYYTLIEHNGSVERYYTYDGGILSKIVPETGLVDYWFPLLIQPYGKGLLLAKQYTGGPSRRPKEFMLGYDIPGENLVTR